MSSSDAATDALRAMDAFLALADAANEPSASDLDVESHPDTGQTNTDAQNDNVLVTNSESVVSGDIICIDDGDISTCAKLEMGLDTADANCEAHPAADQTNTTDQQNENVLAIGIDDTRNESEYVGNGAIIPTDGANKESISIVNDAITSVDDANKESIAVSSSARLIDGTNKESASIGNVDIRSIDYTNNASVGSGTMRSKDGRDVSTSEKSELDTDVTAEEQTELHVNAPQDVDSHKMDMPCNEYTDAAFIPTRTISEEHVQTQPATVMTSNTDDQVDTAVTIFESGEETTRNNYIQSGSLSIGNDSNYIGETIKTDGHDTEYPTALETHAGQSDLINQPTELKRINMYDQEKKAQATQEEQSIHNKDNNQTLQQSEYPSLVNASCIPSTPPSSVSTTRHRLAARTISHDRLTVDTRAAASVRRGGWLSARASSFRTPVPRTPDATSALGHGHSPPFSFAEQSPPNSAPAANTAITNAGQRQLRDEERTIVQAMRKVLENTHARLYDAFQAMDGRRKGALTHEELESGLMELDLGLELNHVRQFVAYIDQDKNGLIHFQEFWKVFESDRPNPSKQTWYPPGERPKSGPCSSGGGGNASIGSGSIRSSSAVEKELYFGENYELRLGMLSPGGGGGASDSATVFAGVEHRDPVQRSLFVENDCDKEDGNSSDIFAEIHDIDVGDDDDGHLHDVLSEIDDDDAHDREIDEQEKNDGNFHRVLPENNDGNLRATFAENGDENGSDQASILTYSDEEYQESLGSDEILTSASPVVTPPPSPFPVSNVNLSIQLDPAVSENTTSSVDGCMSPLPLISATDVPQVLSQQSIQDMNGNVNASGIGGVARTSLPVSSQDRDVVVMDKFEPSMAVRAPSPYIWDTTVAEVVVSLGKQEGEEEHGDIEDQTQSEEDERENEEQQQQQEVTRPKSGHADSPLVPSTLSTAHSSAKDHTDDATMNTIARSAFKEPLGSIIQTADVRQQSIIKNNNNNNISSNSTDNNYNNNDNKNNDNGNCSNNNNSSNNTNNNNNIINNNNNCDNNKNISDEVNSVFGFIPADIDSILRQYAPSADWEQGIADDDSKNELSNHIPETPNDYDSIHTPFVNEHDGNSRLEDISLSLGTPAVTVLPPLRPHIDDLPDTCVSLRIHRAFNVDNLLKYGRQISKRFNVYCSCRMAGGGMKQKTKVAKSSMPVWHEDLIFDSITDADLLNGGELTIRVKKHDRWAVNHILGSATLQLWELITLPQAVVHDDHVEALIHIPLTANTTTRGNSQLGGKSPIRRASWSSANHSGRNSSRRHIRSGHNNKASISGNTRVRNALLRRASESDAPVTADSDLDCTGSIDEIQRRGRTDARPGRRSLTLDDDSFLSMGRGVGFGDGENSIDYVSGSGDCGDAMPMIEVMVMLVCPAIGRWLDERRELTQQEEEEQQQQQVQQGEEAEIEVQKEEVQEEEEEQQQEDMLSETDNDDATLYTRGDMESVLGSSADSLALFNIYSPDVNKWDVDNEKEPALKRRPSGPQFQSILTVESDDDELADNVTEPELLFHLENKNNNNVTSTRVLQNIVESDDLNRNQQSAATTGGRVVVIIHSAQHVQQQQLSGSIRLSAGDVENVLKLTEVVCICKRCDGDEEQQQQAKAVSIGTTSKSGVGGFGIGTTGHSQVNVVVGGGNGSIGADAGGNSSTLLALNQRFIFQNKLPINATNTRQTQQRSEFSRRLSFSSGAGEDDSEDDTAFSRVQRRRFPTTPRSALVVNDKPISTRTGPLPSNPMLAVGGADEDDKNDQEFQQGDVDKIHEDEEGERVDVPLLITLVGHYSSASNRHREEGEVLLGSVEVPLPMMDVNQMRIGGNKSASTRSWYTLVTPVGDLSRGKSNKSAAMNVKVDVTVYRVEPHVDQPNNLDVDSGFVGSLTSAGHSQATAGLRDLAMPSSFLPPPIPRGSKRAPRAHTHFDRQRMQSPAPTDGVVMPIRDNMSMLESATCSRSSTKKLGEDVDVVEPGRSLASSKSTSSLPQREDDRSTPLPSSSFLISTAWETPDTRPKVQSTVPPRVTQGHDGNHHDNDTDLDSVLGSSSGSLAVFALDADKQNVDNEHKSFSTDHNEPVFASAAAPSLSPIVGDNEKKTYPMSGGKIDKEQETRNNNMGEVALGEQEGTRKYNENEADLGVQEVTRENHASDNASTGSVTSSVVSSVQNPTNISWMRDRDVLLAQLEDASTRCVLEYNKRVTAEQTNEDLHLVIAKQRDELSDMAVKVSDSSTHEMFELKTALSDMKLRFENTEKQHHDAMSRVQVERRFLQGEVAKLKSVVEELKLRSKTEALDSESLQLRAEDLSADLELSQQSYEQSRQELEEMSALVVKLNGQLEDSRVDQAASYAEARMVQVAAQRHVSDVGRLAAENKFHGREMARLSQELSDTSDTLREALSDKMKLEEDIRRITTMKDVGRLKSDSHADNKDVTKTREVDEKTQTDMRLASGFHASNRDATSFRGVDEETQTVTGLTSGPHANNRDVISARGVDQQTQTRVPVVYSFEENEDNTKQQPQDFPGGPYWSERRTMEPYGNEEGSHSGGQSAAEARVQHLERQVQILLKSRHTAVANVQAHTRAVVEAVASSRSRENSTTSLFQLSDNEDDDKFQEEIERIRRTKKVEEQEKMLRRKADIQSSLVPQLDLALGAISDLKADLAALKRPFAIFSECLQEARLQLAMRAHANMNKQKQKDKQQEENAKTTAFLFKQAKERHASLREALRPRLAVNVVCTLECLGDETGAVSGESSRLSTPTADTTVIQGGHICEAHPSVNEIMASFAKSNNTKHFFRFDRVFVQHENLDTQQQPASICNLFDSVGSISNGSFSPTSNKPPLKTFQDESEMAFMLDSIVDGGIGTLLCSGLCSKPSMECCVSRLFALASKQMGSSTSSHSTIRMSISCVDVLDGLEVVDLLDTGGPKTPNQLNELQTPSPKSNPRHRLGRMAATPNVDSNVDVTGSAGNTVVEVRSEAEAAIVMRMGQANHIELCDSRGTGLVSHLVFVVRVLRGDDNGESGTIARAPMGTLYCVELGVGASEGQGGVAVRALISAMKRIGRGLVPALLDTRVYSQSLLLAVLRDALESSHDDAGGKTDEVSKSRCFVVHVSFGGGDTSPMHMFQGLGFALHVHKEAALPPRSLLDRSGEYVGGDRPYQNGAAKSIPTDIEQVARSPSARNLRANGHRGRGHIPVQQQEQRWISLAGGDGGLQGAYDEDSSSWVGGGAECETPRPFGGRSLGELKRDEGSSTPNGSIDYAIGHFQPNSAVRSGAQEHRYNNKSRYLHRSEARHENREIIMDVAANIVESLKAEKPNERVYDWFMSLDTGHKGVLSVQQLRKGLVELNSRIPMTHIDAFIGVVIGNDAAQHRRHQHVCFGDFFRVIGDVQAGKQYLVQSPTSPRDVASFSGGLRQQLQKQQQQQQFFEDQQVQLVQRRR